MFILQPMPNQPRGCFSLVGGPLGPNESTTDAEPLQSMQSHQRGIFNHIGCFSQLKQLLQKRIFCFVFSSAFSVIQPLVSFALTRNYLLASSI
jgi:hypothetical protein